MSKFFESIGFPSKNNYGTLIHRLSIELTSKNILLPHKKFNSKPLKTSVTKALLCLFSILVTGCAGVSTVINQPRQDGAIPRYSFIQSPSQEKDSHITLVLAFSGGGTRAAALSYGVLKALRDLEVRAGDKRVRLLDEVDLISSVSGGSFTAAYYGLHGNGIFDDFEERFLRRDVGGALMDRLMSPATWFSSRARSEMAVDYYERTVFQGATFNDLKAAAGPLIIINASDLGGGVRFSFLQEYFSLLCSDLGNFPVARAVTASSAVPLLFSPVVLKNYDGCAGPGLDYLEARPTRGQPAQVTQVVDGLRTFADKENRQFIHLVDGGITDNLGLMAIYEMVEVAGGSRAIARFSAMRPARQLILVTVNAATRSQHTIESSKEPPSIGDTVNTMTDIQLHRYNAATLDLMRQKLLQWAGELSTPETPVTPYMINLGFHSLPKETRDYFNTIPTNLTLTDTQVDRLIAQGERLLEGDPEFLRFLEENQRIHGVKQNLPDQGGGE